MKRVCTWTRREYTKKNENIPSVLKHYWGLLIKATAANTGLELTTAANTGLELTVRD